MKIRFTQSCDPVAYTRLIEATSRSITEYCRRFGHEYDLFVGIKRGTRPWHAALNRITIISDYADAGFDGWVIHMDADAYIHDVSFNISDYLEDLHNRALIIAPAGGPPYSWWNVNNGVFAINLGHEKGREIVRRWRAKLDEITDEALDLEPCWGAVIDDQSILTEVLRETSDCESAVLVDGEILNWNAQFIRQLVRKEGSLEFRANRLSQLVSEALGERRESDSFAGATAVAAYRDLAYGIYHAILLRDPDSIGFETVVDQLIRGERNCLQEMSACFASTEFEQKVPDFLRKYLTPDGVRYVARSITEAA